MANRFPFLSAQWLNLAMVNYRLDASLLQRFVPPGCELDLIDGQAFASLVAFEFAGTRVLGVRWPGFAHFPELNLRFYVRHGQDRGICFVREFVQLKTVARMARWFYNEPFAVAPMQRRVDITPANIAVQQSITIGGKEQMLQVTAAATPQHPIDGSLENFFKDQEWGFGTSRAGRLIRYQVEHPVWATYPVQSFKLDWDWQAIYGDHWKPLQQMDPISVMLVAGSAVKLFPRMTGSSNERRN